MSRTERVKASFKTTSILYVYDNAKAIFKNVGDACRLIQED